MTTKAKLILEKLQVVKEVWSRSLVLLFEALKGEDMLLYLTYPLRKYIASAPEKKAAYAKEILDNISSIEYATKLAKLTPFWKHFIAFFKNAPEDFRLDVVFRALKQAAQYHKSYDVDTLNMKDGKRVKGTILSTSDDKIEIELSDGTKQSVDTDDVKSIKSSAKGPWRLSKGVWAWQRGVGYTPGVKPASHTVHLIHNASDLKDIEKQSNFYTALLGISHMRQLLPAAIVHSSKGEVSAKEKLMSKTARTLIERVLPC